MAAGYEPDTLSREMRTDLRLSWSIRTMTVRRAEGSLSMRLHS